ncbi:MAG: hypothetical protein HYZ17_18140 [Betaproteobacteria bacterium]|nr:hypothetical protein [Betaproteobacteria bacterium]
MPDLPAPAAALVEEELRRLFDSETLRRAPSHMRLLRYLVDKRLAGDAGALREASIALEVFRRDPATYDPARDPIVRVTTRRLRERLETHYAGFDAPPKLRIVLPKGRYAPEFQAGSPNTSEALGLAVLRPRNQSGDPGLDLPLASFAEVLTDQLARAGLPRVLARSSVDAAQAVPATSTQLAQSLGVRYLLDPSVVREPDATLRASVRLLDAADGSVRWVETLIGDTATALLDRLLSLVVARTLDTLPTGAGANHAAPGGYLPLAHAQRAACDQIRFLLLRRTIPATQEAVDLGRRLTEAHAELAEAWAMLAAALYSRQSFHELPQAPLLQELRAANTKALALDPEQPIALRTQGIVRGRADHDGVSAERAFRRVLRASPHYTSARLNLAELLTLMGRDADSLAELNLARHYDPLSPSVLLAKLMLLGMQRRYTAAEEAWALLRAAGEASSWGLWSAGRNATFAGDTATGIARLEIAVQKFPDEPAAPCELACALALGNQKLRARKLREEILRRHPQLPLARLASISACLGERDETLRLLRASMASQDLSVLHTAISPALDWLAEDAELLALLQRSAIWRSWAENRKRAAS